MGSLRVGHDWATNPTLNLQLKKLRDTCKPMAVSFQCMTKSTTNKKKKKRKKKKKLRFIAMRLPLVVIQRVRVQT